MATPLIRAKAKDTVDALDNVTSYFEPEAREEILDNILTTLNDIERVLTHAVENGLDPLDAYRSFVAKFREYWESPQN